MENHCCPNRRLPDAPSFSWHPSRPAVFPKLTTTSATTCSTLSAIATGASLAAYFSESELGDGACLGGCGWYRFWPWHLLWLLPIVIRSPFAMDKGLTHAESGPSLIHPRSAPAPKGDANRDPAWLTAAVLSGLPIIYSMLVRCLAVCHGWGRAVPGLLQLALAASFLFPPLSTITACPKLYTQPPIHPTPQHQILAPAKLVIENASATLDLKERESHLRAWGIKKVGGGWLGGWLGDCNIVWVA